MLAGLILLLWGAILVGCFVWLWRTIFKSVPVKMPTLREQHEMIYPALLLIEETSRRSRARREKGEGNG